MLVTDLPTKRWPSTAAALAELVQCLLEDRLAVLIGPALADVGEVGLVRLVTRSRRRRQLLPTGR